MKSLRKILCPTDWSETSYVALSKAVEMADAAVTELCVIHVEPDDIEFSALPNLPPDTENATLRRVQAVKNLCAVLEERVPPYVRTRPILKQGDAATQIVVTARQEGVDLIVLTTHGAGCSAEKTLGSVAETILRTAPCPVLTLNTTSQFCRNGAQNYSNKFAVTTLGSNIKLMHTHHKMHLNGD